MAVSNSFTVCVSNCNIFKFTDSSDWDTVDTDDITSTILTISFNDVDYTFEESEYVESMDLNPSDFNQESKISDGLYTVSVKYTHSDTTEYTYEAKTFNTCNVKCKLSKVVSDASKDQCTDCNNKTIIDAMILKFYFSDLCKAVVCGNYESAENILSYLEDKLINYKCNNC